MRKTIIIFFVLLLLLLGACMSENKLAKIDTESNYPNLSLTKWGDPVLYIVDEKFKEGQYFSDNKNYSKAIKSFQECINLVKKKKSSLFIDQYLNILIQIAYNYSDLGDQNNALDIYLIREKIIKQEDGWNDVLPKKLNIIVKKEFGQKELLAQSYQDIGICKYNINNFITALDYFKKSNMIYEEIEHFNAILNNYYYIGELSKSKKRWDDLLYAGGSILKLNNTPDDYLILGYRYKFQAYLNLGNKSKAKNELIKLIEFEKSINSPELEVDKDFLKHFN